MTNDSGQNPTIRERLRELPDALFAKALEETRFFEETGILPLPTFSRSFLVSAGHEPNVLTLTMLGHAVWREYALRLEAKIGGGS